MRRSRSEALRDMRGALAVASLAVSGALALAVPKPVSGQTELTDECCGTLLRPTGARALSLGNAITARPSYDGLFVNPALLGPVTDDRVVIHNSKTSLEQSNTFSLLLATRVGTFALSYRLNDFGETESRPNVPGAPPSGSIALFEHVLMATYGTTIAAGLSAGVSYKLFQFRLDCRGFCGTEGFAATTHMLDVGAHLRLAAVPALQLGASLVHVGFPLQVVNEAQASPPPARLRIGAAYEVLRHTRLDSIADLHVSMDVVERPTDPGSPTVHVGAELSLEETLFVRAGYGGGSGDVGGLGVGVGVRYDRFDLGVAKSFVSSALDESDPFQVTFAIRF